MSPESGAAPHAELALEVNRAALCRHHPHAYRRILDGLPSAPLPEALAGPGGGMSLCHPDAPAPAPSSRASGPAAEARATIARAGAGDAETVLVFGFGAGDLPLAALEGASRDARVVVVVLDPGAFAIALRHRPLDRLLADPRLTIVVGTLGEMAAQMPRDEASMAVVVDERLLAGASPELRPLADMASELWARQVSSAIQSADIIENVTANLGAILDAPPAGGLRGVLEGRTALLVAPGPSLEGQLDRLARAARPFTLALDTAAAPLADAAVAPDLVVTLDPTMQNLRKFERLPVSLTLAFFEGARPEAVHRHARRVFVCERGGLLDGAHPFFGRDGRFESAGNVLVAGLDLLLRAGASRVVLTGADLAPRNGQLHAGRPGGTGAAGSMREVEARGGGTVMIPESLWRHRRRLLRRISREPHGRVVDATASGASLPGLPRVSLAEALGPPDERGPGPRLHDWLTRHNGPDPAERREAERAARAALDEIRAKCQEEDR